MTGFNPKNANKYLGTDQYITFFVSRNRSPTDADYRQPETGRNYAIGTIWQVGKNPTTGLEGDLWILSKIVANVAYWVQFASGSVGPIVNWIDVTSSSEQLVVGNGYITDNAGGVTYTLPATALEGNIIRITGKSGLWTIAQNAGQQIHVGSGTTTLGVTGSIVATNTFDAIELLCITGGSSTVWTTLSDVGNLTLN